MSIRIGMKPIVTDGLSHVYDPISTTSYPSGSESLFNHLPNSVCTAQGDGTDVINRTLVKESMTAYGAETAHQKLKGYLTYDGTNDCMADSNYFKSGWPITWCVWARATGTGTRYLMNRSKHYGYSTYVPNTGMYLGMQSGNATMIQILYSSNQNIYNSYTATATGYNVEDSKWHFWVARWEANNSIKLNIDYDASVAVNTTTTQNSPANAGYMHIGNRWYYNGQYNNYLERDYWAGDIGPIYIYDRSITDAEIKQNYEAGYDRFVTT